MIAGIVSRPYRASRAPAARATAVIDEVPRATLQAEIAALPPDHRLVDRGRFHVYCARAGQIPWALQEIGRLREVTFRAVGEGTGRCSDLDPFDAVYLHLFVWDAPAASIAGAYRLGLVDEILARHGKRGLYTHSLFKYRTRMLDSLSPAIELGRSFVRAEYQRSFAPLLLLWAGIGRFVERSPRYAVLFGPVSISARYAPASRRLIVEYLSAHSADTRLAREVKPRRPFRTGARTAPSTAAMPAPGSIDELSRRIAQIEHDGKGVPVLLRHYLQLGGRLLGFSLDRDFADTLDGLIMVDLREVEEAVLARYMGKQGAAGFRAYHALDTGCAGRALPGPSPGARPAG
ncbi:MAG: GNAT family N-acyltransferase [Candidatus Rokuibacteriota bacterium]